MDELMDRMEKLLGEVRVYTAKVRSDGEAKDFVHCRKLLQGIRRSAFALRQELQKERVVASAQPKEKSKAVKKHTVAAEPVEVSTQI